MPTTKKTKVKVTCIECPNCKDIIYSRAHHDFHYCSCTQVAIDGGFDYVRILGNNTKTFSKFIIGVNRDDLFNDWNENINKYGCIKPEGREVKEVKKIIKLWVFKKEFILQNKKLKYFIDYRLHEGRVELIKPLFHRKDYRIGKWYFTLIDEIIIDYEIKEVTK